MANGAEPSAHRGPATGEWRPLQGMTLPISGAGVATDYAERLLRSLGAETQRLSDPPDPHPALAWARSGAMALTGSADGPGQMCPAPLASCVDGALTALRLVAQEGQREPASPWPDSTLLGERATIAGLRRAGQISPGGACRLLPCADGWIALSLPRPDDWRLLPAWLETADVASWPTIAEAVAGARAETLIERGRLLGLALAISATPKHDAARPVAWFRVMTRSEAAPVKVSRDDTPLVVDLSSLWAGPLCTRLLRTLGAQVVKVESRQRPDGARFGPEPFHDLMNQGKASIALDFTDPADIDRLRRLLLVADIVVESARPRALRQLGINAEAILAENPRLTWVGITGHGSTEPAGQWIAYGDDAGVAAGLTAALCDATGDIMFCGDAIADPITGVHAALAAWSAHRAGGGALIDLSLADVARHCLAFQRPRNTNQAKARWRQWQAIAVAKGVTETRVPFPTITTRARPLGADTAATFREFGIPC